MRQFIDLFFYFLYFFSSTITNVVNIQGGGSPLKCLQRRTIAGTEKFSADAESSRRMMLRRHCQAVHLGNWKGAATVWGVDSLKEGTNS